MAAQTVDMRALTRRTYTVGIVAILALAAMFFLPAGTLAYWQAWMYMATVMIPMAFVARYMLRKSPELLERRLRARERERTQRGIIPIGTLLLLGAFILPGFDFRWHWSGMPWWVSVAADGIVFVGYLGVIRVFRENAYASRTVQVDAGQQVISTGPYAVIRHPMYASVLLFYLAGPIALGSWWAIIPAASIIPILVIRILDEERVLERDLNGYREYKHMVKYRLMPGLW